MHTQTKAISRDVIKEKVMFLTREKRVEKVEERKKREKVEG